MRRCCFGAFGEILTCNKMITLGSTLWSWINVLYPKYCTNSNDSCTFAALGPHGSTKHFCNFAFEGDFFHVVMGKTNTKLDFLYIIGSALKCWLMPSSIYIWFLKPLSVLHSRFPTKKSCLFKNHNFFSKYQNFFFFLILSYATF